MVTASGGGLGPKKLSKAHDFCSIVVSEGPDDPRKGTNLMILRDVDTDEIVDRASVEFGQPSQLNGGHLASTALDVRKSGPMQTET